MKGVVESDELASTRRQGPAPGTATSGAAGCRVPIVQRVEDADKLLSLSLPSRPEPSQPAGCAAAPAAGLLRQAPDGRPRGCAAAAAAGAPTIQGAACRRRGCSPAVPAAASPTVPDSARRWPAAAAIWPSLLPKNYRVSWASSSRRVTPSARTRPRTYSSASSSSSRRTPRCARRSAFVRPEDAAADLKELVIEVKRFRLS
jgi:hypothetical protein